MSYVTYENRNNPHVTIHRDGCSQIAKRGGEHQYGQGDTERTKRIMTRRGTRKTPAYQS